MTCDPSAAKVIADTATLGRVDKAPEGDSPDAARCDSKLIFMREIGGDPGTVERR
jgi:hypothetical protein